MAKQRRRKQRNDTHAMYSIMPKNVSADVQLQVTFVFTMI